ncbi:M56 family metallopeptidase [Kitasatospora sp. NBC_01539]|uniref:M56 family metallopeptidase n=1 Tax=Kitasatospora sp. NBC_01539 TaxID=2903577 RepID=UPI0038602287
MIASIVLVTYAVLVGFVVPRFLARAKWPLRAPGTAIALWQALTVSFVVCFALAWYHAIAPGRHLHGLLGSAEQWISGAPERTTADGLSAEGVGLLIPIALTAVWPAAWFIQVTASAARRRRRHTELLDLVGRTEPALGAVIVDHDTPAAYCLPGRPSRVVLTSGAVRCLSPAQVQAILAHERAHLTGRHHLLSAASEAFARAYPVVPLARAARESTAELLEMVCDDRALRSACARALADAMCEVAAGSTPKAALGAGGSAVLTRLRRLLRPSAPLRPITCFAILLLGAVAAALPYFISCGPVIG